MQNNKIKKVYFLFLFEIFVSLQFFHPAHADIIHLPEGKFVKTWGRRGSGHGELDRPMHIYFGPDNHLYVAEYLNDRIQVFDRNGKYIQYIGLKQYGKSYFDTPAGVAVDNEGYVYVADFYHHQIQEFSPDGSFIASFGKPGRVWTGDFTLSY